MFTVRSMGSYQSNSISRVRAESQVTMVIRMVILSEVTFMQGQTTNRGLFYTWT